MSGSQHPQNRRNALNPPPVCFNCGVTGHFVVACPQQSRETPAGFTAEHGSGPLSLNLHNQQLKPYKQQHITHTIQQYNPSNCIFQETVYNSQSPAIISPYSAFENQPTAYLSTEPNTSLHYSVPRYASQNYQYGISVNSPPTIVSNFQSPFLTSHSSPQSQWDPVSSNHSKSHLHHCAFKSDSKQVYPAVFRDHLQYSDHIASKSGYLDKDSVLQKKSKYLSFTSLNRSYVNSRDVNFRNKGKHLNSQVGPDLKANKTESSIKTNSHQTSITQKSIYKKKTELGPSSSVDDEFSALPAKQVAQKCIDLSEKDYEDEIWDWEYHAIFKELLRDETVELAQPLATGFKSTPVPLFRAWSPTVPSVSRYARKENIKEFTRSIRSSPQWSYMLEDPAFMDIEFDGSFISLEEVSTWISVRHGEINGLDEKDDENSNNIKCRKRERRDDGDDNSEQNDIDNQIRGEKGEITQGPQIKKQRLALLDGQSDRDHKNTQYVRTSNVKSGPLVAIAMDHGDGESSQVGEKVLSHDYENKRSSRVCVKPVYRIFPGKIEFSSNSFPTTGKNQLSPIAQEKIDKNLSSNNSVITEPRRNVVHGLNLIQIPTNPSLNDSMHNRSSHNNQEDYVKFEPPILNILEKKLSIHSEYQNSSDQNNGLSKSHDISFMQPQNGLKPTLQEKSSKFSSPSSTGDSTTCVQHYLPFSSGSSRTVLTENPQKNSSVLFSNQHKILSRNPQSPDVTLFPKQNSPEYHCPNTENEIFKSLNRKIVFAASSTDPCSPEINQPQGQWTKKNNIQTHITQKSTHQITRKLQSLKHNKTIHLSTIYDPQKISCHNTHTYKMQDLHQTTDTLNDSEIPEVSAYDQTPQTSETEKNERFNSYSNCAKYFDFKSEHLSQNQCHQQSQICKILRSKDLESKEKSKFNDNIDKIVDPAISPTSANILDKLNREENNDPVSRSREELSKRARRHQPKVEAAYSRRW